MIKPRNGWRDRLVGVLSMPKRLALAAVRLWPKDRQKKTSHEQWDPVTPPPSSSNVHPTSPSPISSPLDVCIAHDEDIDHQSKIPRGIDELIWNGSAVRVADESMSHPTSGLSMEQPNQSQQEENTNEKRLTLGEIPFSVITQCAPSELPEDVERLIFEMAAREDRQAALHTLVLVDHRVRKWCVSNLIAPTSSLIRSQILGWNISSMKV